MDDEATPQTVGQGQEDEAIRAVRHQGTRRQLLEIVVEALTRNVKEDHIREIFGKYGVIKDLRMPMNPTFNVNRGTAYIIWMAPRYRSQLFFHDAVFRGHHRLRAEVHRPEKDTTTIMTVMEAAVVEGDVGEDLLVDIDHRRWMDHAIDLHRADGRQIEEGIGDVVGVDEEVVVEVMADRAHTPDLGVDHHGEVDHRLSADHHLGRHPDGEVGTVGVIVHPGEAGVAAEEVGEVEGVRAIVRMAVVALGIAA
ncbi:uncharacterized protein K460DRAFT_409983 [Cucurbitaria berberidis CBS 394.84]|uniref:RRM domain-containing protein n=1 Tax=Cucurbitaria berberidis CBS 394.84 TaxID=1168544 RepID=A0A9P4GBK9_9PLEO|nr:uncharacterized protein K460DRAFT_409983 [Cucurbitaria berberidis CBS 394.84]KAF1842580.1 hypothetical protein K460DRAFT_409983 [Cucurbitaria berberidis CBS 394.84]